MPLTRPSFTWPFVVDFLSPKSSSRQEGKSRTNTLFLLTHADKGLHQRPLQALSPTAQPKYTKVCPTRSSLLGEEVHIT